MHGGDIVAEVLAAQQTRFLFTLCGGHISPILVASKARGIRVIDTRHEATAVFAADATARLTHRPGVAAVTAGPGLTNTITAVKNAQMAQSPVVLLGGAAPTALQGRGALQDIDQAAVIRPHVKWLRRVRRVRDLGPAVEEAFRRAQEGVQGPVFIECPVDLLYDEATVRKWYGAERGGKGLADRLVKGYLRWHVQRIFAGAGTGVDAGAFTAAAAIQVEPPQPAAHQVAAAWQRLAKAQRPVILVGSQAMSGAADAAQLAAAVTTLGVPVYLSGMARGLLGRDHWLQLRHQRRAALKEADFVLLAGVPCDFRLDYGNHIRRRAYYVAANRSREDLTKNRKPDLGILGDPGRCLVALAAHASTGTRWTAWLASLRDRDNQRNGEIAVEAQAPSQAINPVHLCRLIDAQIGSDSIVIGDGGDIVATAAYIVQPPGPLRWLDPGAFGTLGVGAGFALAAKLVHPEAQVWVIFGDGTVGYSLSEFDTFVRHSVPIIAVVGNDASWSQIAREQVEMLHDAVGTVLAHTDYDRVVTGFGAVGLRSDDPELASEVLAAAVAAANAGSPVLVNAVLGKTDFRKGSISM